MKRDNSIPKCIKEGILCFMTGTLMFIGNSMVVEAEESEPDNISPETTNDSATPETPAENESENNYEEAAKDLVDLPSEPNTSSDPVVEETGSGTETTVENTYTETHEDDNGVSDAVATTTETVTVTEANPDSLTKDYENATETVSTDENGNTVITTEGSYVEPVSTTETKSTTIIATTNEDLAHAVINEVQERSHNNTENEGINLDQVSDNTFLDNGIDENPTALNQTQAMELAGVADGTTLVVETTNGESVVSADGEELNLSKGLTDLITDSAEKNVVESSTTYSLNGNDVSAEELNELGPDSLGYNTNFNISKVGDETVITYKDANGQDVTVNDADLKAKILDGATISQTGTAKQELEVLEEYQVNSITDDNDALKTKINDLTAIGYTNFSLKDGTGTYVNGEIEKETYNTQAEADARAAELNNDTAHYSNATVTPITNTVTTPNTSDYTGLTPTAAQNLAKDLVDNQGYAEANVSITTNKTASETEANSIKADLLSNEALGLSENDIKIVENKNEDGTGNGTYTISIEKSFTDSTTANQIKEALIGKGFDNATVVSTPGTADTLTPQTFTSAEAAQEYANAHSDYTLSHEYTSEADADNAIAAINERNDSHVTATKTKNTDGSYTVSVQASYDNRDDAWPLINFLRDNKYSVANYFNPTENFEKTGSYTSGTFTSLSAAEQHKNSLGNGYANAIVHTVTTSSDGRVLENFDGFSLTDKAEYDRIIKLPTVNENGKTLYVEDNGNGTKTYYQLYKETYTIIAESGSISTPWGGDQHQEGSYIIGDKHRIDNNVDPNNQNDPARCVNFSEVYDPDFTAYIDQMTDTLNAAENDNNGYLNPVTRGGDFGDKKYEITESGTYYVDASIESRIYVAPQKDVTIILTSTTGTAYVPVTTDYDFQPFDTGNGKVVNTNVTFVTDVSDVRYRGRKTFGNLLAPTSTVTLNSSNFAGTIVCDTIAGYAEGHKVEQGISVYYVDTRQTELNSTSTYYVTADKGIRTFTVSAEKNVYSEIISGSKEATTYKLTASDTVDLKDVTASKEVTKYEVTADTLAPTKILVAEREVKTETGTATLTKTEKTTTQTTLDRTFSIKISRYSKESTTGTWTETRTNELPPDTPDTPPETPPDTPDTPPETPPDTPTPTPVIVIDDVSPVAQEVAQVLGARRAQITPSGPAVLGARRGRTGDMAHSPLYATLMIMGASATALGILASSKKKKDEDEA